MQETDRTTFQPPKPGGTGRSFALAMLAHGLLLLALTWGIRWNNQPDTMSVSAELWSALPQEAAPPLHEPEPVQTPPPPPPEPVKAPEPAPPPPPKPAVQPDRADADIALQKEKALKEKKQREDKLREEKAQKEKDRKENERKEKELKDKAEKAKQVAQDKKRAEEKAKKEAQAKAEEEKRSEAQRQANIKRSLGLAGASGSEDAKGTALKSSGPSAEYAGRIVARIKPKITFTGDRDGNPKAEVELRVDSSTGTIMSRKLIQTSGNKTWDEAVLKAIDKTETLPRDTDNKVPPVMVISFRPKD